MCSLEQTGRETRHARVRIVRQRSGSGGSGDDYWESLLDQKNTDIILFSVESILHGICTLTTIERIRTKVWTECSWSIHPFITKRSRDGKKILSYSYCLSFIREMLETCSSRFEDSRIEQKKLSPIVILSFFLFQDWIAPKSMRESRSIERWLCDWKFESKSRKGERE